jgi:hypothetical protein
VSTFVPTIRILECLKQALQGIQIGDSGSEAALFDSVEIYPNKGLAAALRDLVITRSRVCLIVPSGYKYTHKETGVGTILATRYLEVDLLIADRAVTKGGIQALTGGPNNIGIIEMSDAVVLAISGKAMSGYGGVIPADGAPLEVATKDAQDIPGRLAWAQSLLIPGGTVRALVA